MGDDKLKDALVGSTIAGCEIIEKIAVGGMGAVFKARHKALDRIVCVKILSPALAEDQKAVSLFLTEARAIAELDHPNIVNVYNVGRERGLYFIIMSFISGDNVSNIIRRRPNLPAGFILNIFQDVLKGLAVAHEKGIIHRDIKPSNILINEKLQAKIVDFGIAKKLEKDKTVTRTTEMAGTAYFISPEQAVGGDIDARADLYSAGATLYFMLTGQFPYKGKTSMDIIQKHINSPVPAPIDIRKDIPAWLSLVTQKLMAKKPEDRFQSAQETLDYIIKMRAEDQLKIKDGAASVVDIGGEAPLRVRAEKANTSTEAPRVRRTTESFNLKKGEPSGVKMPVVGTSAFKTEVEKKRTSSVEPSSKEALETRGFNIKSGKPPSAFDEMFGMLKKVFFHIPVFFAVTVAAVAFLTQFGAAVASSAPEGARVTFFGAFEQIFSLAALSAKPQATIAALVISVVCFIMACMNAYARQAFSLFIILAFSYLAGFFGGEGSFLGAFSAGLSNISAQDYCLIYMCAGFVAAITLMFGKALTPLRIICSVLILLTVWACKNFAALDVAPSDAQVITLLFYSAILLTVSAAAIVIPKSFVFSSLLPLLLMVLALASVLSYMVSGRVYAVADEVMKTKEVQAYVAKHGENKEDPKTSGGKLVELDINFGHSLLTAAAALKDIAESPDKAKEGAKTEEFNPINYFAKIYVERGESRMYRAVWREAVLYPFNRAAWDSRETMLFKYGALFMLFFANVYFIVHLIFRRDI